jgi:hypothetical protein
MTTNEVTDFIKLNGFTHSNNLLIWWHPIHPQVCISDADLYVRPDEVFNKVEQALIKSGFKPLYSLNSSAHNGQLGQVIAGPVNATPQQFTFTSGKIDTSSWGSDWGGAVIRPLSRCDCGAEKCKTTHAHWCSTRS